MIETACDVEVTTAGRRRPGEDGVQRARHRGRADPDHQVRRLPLVDRGARAEELADRCTRTLERAEADGVDALLAEQRDVARRVLGGAPTSNCAATTRRQQAIRWNLFQLAQASARTQEQGIAAKGVTAGGYDGHYFWDTEVYVVPFLAYTDQEAARKLIRFRWAMLDAACARAPEMSQVGALYPWRTINGEEASAYYAAGTAQYHINAAVVFALAATSRPPATSTSSPTRAPRSSSRPPGCGPTSASTTRNGSHGVPHPSGHRARRVHDRRQRQHVHERDGAVQAALRRPHGALPRPSGTRRRSRRSGRDTDLDLGELDDWDAAADAMFIPFDEELGIHPQDASFLELEPWDWEGTPADKYPLLLNFHPLVIYRHQVLKQADVVLATFLRREHFSPEQKRRNFDYYDPITTGDSSLSACVQSIVAAEVGYDELALDYFHRALYLDLCDSHGNTADGVHVANVGGVWAGIVHGFAGHGRTRRPPANSRPACRHRGTASRSGSGATAATLQVDLESDRCTLTVLDGIGVPIRDGHERLVVTPDAPYVIAAAP